ncbi:transcription antitermination factor NusB [Pacificimonas sp. WHA3]|uniref:Transcription antitermination protein NusB n=1 Tax=Pacificimonas pallii TaxID=2827236 RepID=A0ABS6SDN5_9SPHN|nr:transcription antitermination factor NusB [Pacificimonas pallii]MBV7256203.1 transcription antitermination factor NusB [Pacificimonas pallii]
MPATDLTPPPRPSRPAARLAAVQALYQRDMSGAPVPDLLREFHEHRLGREIEGDALADADVDLFDEIVSGVALNAAEYDQVIQAALAAGWTIERLDRPMLQILRCGTYELAERKRTPKGAIISEYVDVAKAFYESPEPGFANGVLDTIAKTLRG